MGRQFTIWDSHLVGIHATPPHFYIYHKKLIGMSVTRGFWRLWLPLRPPFLASGCDRVVYPSASHADRSGYSSFIIPQQLYYIEDNVRSKAHVVFLVFTTTYKLLSGTSLAPLPFIFEVLLVEEYRERRSSATGSQLQYGEKTNQADSLQFLRVGLHGKSHGHRSMEVWSPSLWFSVRAMFANQMWITETPRITHEPKILSSTTYG